MELIERTFNGVSGSVTIEYRGSSLRMMVYNDSGQSLYLPLKYDEVEGIERGLRQGFYQASVSRRAMIMVTTRLPYLEVEVWDVYHPRSKVRAVFFVNEVRRITEMLQDYLAITTI